MHAEGPISLQWKYRLSAWNLGCLHRLTPVLHSRIKATLPVPGLQPGELYPGPGSARSLPLFLFCLAGTLALSLIPVARNNLFFPRTPHCSEWEHFQNLLHCTLSYRYLCVCIVLPLLKASGGWGSLLILVSPAVPRILEAFPECFLNKCVTFSSTQPLSKINLMRCWQLW